MGDGGDALVVDGVSFALTLAVGLIGLLFVRYAVSKLVSGKGASSDKQAVKKVTGEQGQVVCSVGVQDKQRLVESTSDFLRNISSIYVASRNGLDKLEDLLPEVKGVKGDGAVSEATVEKLVRLMHEFITEQVKTVSDGNLKLSDGVAALAIEMLTVTPSMDCLLHAKVMPPSMYQPTYTLLISSNNVHCVTDGFIGFPVLGPADPNKKYTQKRMRLLTADLVEVAVEGSSSIKVDYFMCSTSAENMRSLVNRGVPLIKSICANDRSGSTSWKEYLLS
mmetsp:Transcript_3311/g.4787  ORF Transcript_3311/g.4787 Transcript_3311/m.4787 type:complete len:278 (+) Transcript_3311:370-1203(+)|eukprot:CAMPEP_0203754456 /NCGR_PEP_ID=MMETSP0098-20131031/8046_1 /ASSEMBLY_ACC=CAM_ASM_000208 /TAXON_ID=96639 /ORGANISM=" , Strain NY0313808BC1" /LENGTH=277 /DNA_ID=CAMNT_0050645465 /DNA_START=362 /DNA_END=1195 /DNA_ORIENTATION=+